MIERTKHGGHITDVDGNIKAFPDYKEKMVAYFIFSPHKKPQRGRKKDGLSARF